jgi:hypothetical protein
VSSGSCRRGTCSERSRPTCSTRGERSTPEEDGSRPARAPQSRLGQGQVDRRVLCRRCAREHGRGARVPVAECRRLAVEPSRFSRGPELRLKQLFRRGLDTER